MYVMGGAVLSPSLFVCASWLAENRGASFFLVCFSFLLFVCVGDGKQSARKRPFWLLSLLDYYGASPAAKPFWRNRAASLDVAKALTLVGEIHEKLVNSLDPDGRFVIKNKTLTLIDRRSVIALFCACGVVGGGDAKQRSGSVFVMPTTPATSPTPTPRPSHAISLCFVYNTRLSL